MTANIIAGIAVLVALGAAFYAAHVERKLHKQTQALDRKMHKQTQVLERQLQKQDHQHAEGLQRQQQAHELQISAFETHVQQKIAKLTAEMVAIERSRRAEEKDRAQAAKLSAATANLTMTISGHPRLPQLEIVNTGPAAARNVALDVVAQLEPPGGSDGRLPQLVYPERLQTDFPARSSQRLPIELFGGQGAEVELSWEDGRSGRHTERRVLRLEVERSGKVW